MRKPWFETSWAFPSMADNNRRESVEGSADSLHPPSVVNWQLRQRSLPCHRRRMSAIGGTLSFTGLGPKADLRDDAQNALSGLCNSVAQLGATRSETRAHEINVDL